MNIEIAMRVSGFLFLLILVLYFAKMALGNQDLPASDYDSDAKLQKINKDPAKFKLSIVVALIHDVSVVALAIMMFIAFGPYSLILGIVWTIFRTGEGLILIYNEKSYWGLRHVARQYSVASGADKDSLGDLALSILKTKYSRFTFAMILWSIGTLAYSILFVTSGVAPLIIGWLGIVASVIVVFVNGKKLAEPNYEGVPGLIGGLLAILFEISIGVWLIL